MNRALRKVAVVGAAVTLVLAGCGRESGGEQEKATSVAEGKASGEVTVWAMGTEGEKLGAFAQDFMKENPDAKVTVTAVPWDAAHQKIASAIAAKQTPDVSMIGSTWQGEFAKTGALDPTPPELFQRDSYFPGAWDTTVVNDTSYGVPWYVETRVIYYRTDIAAKAGITKPPATWAELSAMAKAMQGAGAKWGINLQPGKTGSWQSVMPFAWSNGVEVSDGTKYTFDSPEMVEALRFYQSFFTGKLAPTELAEGALEPGFAKGEIAAFLSGPWMVDLIKKQGGAGFEDKFAVAPMPKQKSATSFIGGSNIAVFKDAKNRDAAWKFLQWLAQPAVQTRWYQTTSDLPAVRSAWQDPALAGDKFLKVFGEQLKDAKAPPTFATWEQVSAAFDTEVEKLAKSGEDPATVARTVQSKAEAIGTGS
ncbi:sugar ABC transporter substrate-binding protein [Actinoplanes sp. NBRC 103695]|uniref:sugar ABC transporter substrate-binding protein n=1 Tax=Actinoplanes sp. NBRC 103695 TaxID=3032202 RepID=UPI0024A39DBE|nr:sugar ABC transporter substrate-binding protein [Actinoplanes sp. NBRC 103695]GLY95173.1 sugar ABC transporter substrate-binding protein [Actinoplanes sp. NBRC 103695]